MPKDRQTLLDKLDKAYSVHFDKEDIPDGIPGLAGCYAFHAANESYVISKKVKLWRAEMHEYAYVFSFENLDAAAAFAALENAKTLAKGQIHPGREHMQSNITAVFVCGSIEDDATKLLKKTRYHKNYLLMLRGWTDLRTGAVDISKDAVMSNRAGKDLAPFLRENLNRC
ncbi:MAG: hypothetical protein J5855_10380 [Mailhella sp.]|nr:hypothetical protein [Mailhella sp.]